MSSDAESRTDLTLRSAAQRRVSKGVKPHRVCCPSFETRACGARLRMRFTFP